MVVMKKIKFKGDRRSFKSISKEYGISHNTLRKRYNDGLRNDDLVKQPRKYTDRTQIVIDFKDGKTTFGELSKQYNIRIEKLYQRYKNGSRDDELVSSDDLPTKVSATYYIKGQPYRMSEVERKRKSDAKIPTSEIQSRLDLGLSMEEALKFSIKYAAKFGHICYEIEGNGCFYYIPIDDVNELRRNGISMADVERNVLTVDDISELLLEDTRVFEEDYDYDSSISTKLNEQHRKQKIQEYKDVKHREQKPHLFDGTPQVHKWGSYAEYLASSYTFACSDIEEDK
ncbi:hypothetical protein IR133_10085 [Staphylococcus saprophyticus]|nr:hypothetical protein [Staphylococcus saprophyticus]TFV23360.1 hypothetical protein E4T75_10085 [Staphylococcus saprophyticus]